MINRPMGKGVRALLSIVLLSIGLSSCDYWPPALQAQLEQMQIEVQIATAERAKLQGQLTDIQRMKDELQIRVDELARSNSEFSKLVSTLEQALSTEREKVSRLVRMSHQPSSGKATMKATQKSQLKKKSVATRTKP